MANAANMNGTLSKLFLDGLCQISQRRATEDVLIRVTTAGGVNIDGGRGLDEAA